MEKEIKIALAGNPNSGKTTVFNNLTGSRQHVGNYPGVTVEKKTGEIKYRGYKINIVDLPGTYSLTAYSLDEIVTRNFIIDEKPDVVVDIIDSSNLERNLYLGTQLMELGVPLVFAFNMTDIARGSGKKIDIELLSELLNVSIIETVGHQKKGMDKLLDAVVDAAEKKSNGKKVVVRYGEEIENEIKKIISVLKEEKALSERVDSRWVAVKLLEQDKEVIKATENSAGISYGKIEKAVNNSIDHVKNILRDSPETAIADARYGFISGALAESYEEVEAGKITISDKIDKVMINSFRHDVAYVSVCV
ncbi:MAG: ferrous iron transporter B [Actinomycetia bacterium]|nr:ferrous iron transporter B [Actinomycetes bacterium]